MCCLKYFFSNEKKIYCSLSHISEKARNIRKNKDIVTEQNRTLAVGYKRPLGFSG